MKRMIILASLLCVVFFVSAVFADTTADFNFTGTGTATLDFVPGDDAIVRLYAAGNGVIVSGQCVDGDNNPYNYGVDSIQAWLRFDTSNGGGASLEMQRLDSHGSMYGPAGQTSLWSVFSSDGTASLAARSAMNYADLIDSEYGFQNNTQLEAAGSTFQIQRYVDNGNGDWVSVSILGNGAGALTNMNSGADGNGFTTEGWTGCYENNSAMMSGSSTTFVVQAQAQHAMSWETGSSTGVTSYYVQIDQNGGSTTVDNWWVAGN